MSDDSFTTTNNEGGHVGRRGLLRGGALLAGAAAGAAIATVATTGTAHAADGDAVEIGADNAATSTTTLGIGADAGSGDPALDLRNADGPALRLQPLAYDWAGELEVGELAGTELGPVVGVDTAEGPVSTYLVTGVDLADVATPFPTQPRRILDLRTETGRESIRRRSSADALTSDGKLRARQWIDVAVLAVAQDYFLDAAFVNLTVVGPSGGGHAILYPPGARPMTSSINFTAGQTLGNAAFVGTPQVLGFHAVRLYTTVDAWFVIDVTGGVNRGALTAPLGAAARVGGVRSSLTAKIRRSLGKLAR